ncbi:MAG: amidohydrolase [Aquificae bacterium]|nr:amidohydrolase [Aquificota bacterium]
MDKNLTEYKSADIIIKDKKILDIGTNKAEKFSGKTIDASNMIAIPGLINAHTHAAMTLLRGYGSDNPLKVWLEEYIWPIENRFVSYEFVKDGTDIACYEMLRNGITCFVDMYFYEEAVAQRVKQSGMRAVLCTGILDFPSPGAKDSKESLEKTKDFIAKFKTDEQIYPCVGPHAPYTCSPETLEKAMEIAFEFDTLFHIHLSETEFEVEQIKDRYGATPIKHLDNIGILNDRILAAHVVHPTEEEINLMAEKDVKVAHCPESNLKLASGISPVPQMLKEGITVSIGTDGTASNDDLDIIGEISTAAKLHKGFWKDPTLLNAKQALLMATREGAKALRLEDKIGSIEKDKYADIVLIDKNTPHLQPMFDPYVQIVYSGKGLDVDTVIVGGNIVVKNKDVINIDKNYILDRASYWYKKITENT